MEASIETIKSKLKISGYSNSRKQLKMVNSKLQEFMENSLSLGIEKVSMN